MRSESVDAPKDVMKETIRPPKVFIMRLGGILEWSRPWISQRLTRVKFTLGYIISQGIDNFMFTAVF